MMLQLGMSDSVSTHSRPKAAGILVLYCIKDLRFQHTAARRRLVENFGRINIRIFCFNTQPPEGGWFCSIRFILIFDLFQHTAARRRLADVFAYNKWHVAFQHTAARRRLVKRMMEVFRIFKVSTHSRPKAAGRVTAYKSVMYASFNTQPPEGGWPMKSVVLRICRRCFNTQPPEGGWLTALSWTKPKFSFNTQPPEGGWLRRRSPRGRGAGFNTQPPEGGWAFLPSNAYLPCLFQHTAARRRLAD